VVCEPAPSCDPTVTSLLLAQGIEPRVFTHGTPMLEDVVRTPPGVVIYVVRAAAEEDLGVLELLRSMAPACPLVLVSADGSLAALRRVQNLRPMYYAVLPVEGVELREAVEAALARRRPAPP
jgi:FixJ family two-component response regulator